MNLLFLIALFSGNWIGSGTMVDASGKQVSCQLKISLEHTADSFVINAGSSVCGSQKRSWPTVTLKIQEGQLSWRGGNIGTITDNTLHAEITDPRNGRHVEVHATEQNGALAYQEIWSEPGQAKYLVIKGNLKRQ
jgi:hypothetical protein